MPRVARLVVPDIPYHVTHRGNKRDPVFFRRADREVYLELLRGFAEREGLDVWAYCLMTNHVHLVAVPRNETALARGVGQAHGKYSRWVNVRKKWTGHLWANRFFSCALGDEHLWRAVRYVERNPVRAGLVARAENYAWSSAAAHVQACETGDPPSQFDALLSPTSPLPGDVEDWSAWLTGDQPAGEVDELRLHTRTGRPLGPKSFVTRLEKIVGRPLASKGRGRPRKSVRDDE